LRLAQWERSRSAHVARAALMYLHYQADQGTSCPLTMTYACVPTISKRRNLPRLVAAHRRRRIRRRSLPCVAKSRQTPSAWAMTEKQGGSDVRSNSTRATPLGDGLFELIGHKWFFSGRCATPSWYWRTRRPGCRVF
jgi:putative acyl-CoA dehydrogenase